MSSFKKTAKTSEIVIFGNAEMAELAKYYFDLDSPYHPIAFVVDDSYLKDDEFQGLPVIPWSQVALKYPPSVYKMHVALSYRGLNKLREDKFYQCKKAGYELVSYFSSKATTFPDLLHGENCFILENQNIQPRVKLGDNVMLWSGNHIGHGTTISDHAYVASHVVISGHVSIGARCFIGVNATVRDFINIGEDCFIGMSGVVTRDLSPGSVVLPSRSEIVPGSDAKAKRLITSTFGSIDN